MKGARTKVLAAYPPCSAHPSELAHGGVWGRVLWDGIECIWDELHPDAPPQITKIRWSERFTVIPQSEARAPAKGKAKTCL